MPCKVEELLGREAIRMLLAMPVGILSDDGLCEHSEADDDRV
jgi:hypothetical protein